ncbi:MAG: amidase [Gammaproteobacteria bacterium]|nr:amidase [Gammaproteobacteria bacterium]
MTIPLNAQVTDLTELSLVEASDLIRRRALSPIDLTRAYLDRIRQLQPLVNAYITITEELALAQAAQLEQELMNGHWRGPLHGIPIGLKDNIDTAGILTTAASTLLQDRVPETDAPIYTRLRDAGCILLGKLNMHEFAWGGTSAITHFGPVHNPWNLDHIPGGSSGGSAAAMAARMCCAALGTDTLASIRLPAAYCGVTGLKASHGLASIRQIIPVAESLDHVGPLCRSVADSAYMLQAMKGFDALDPVSIEAPAANYIGALMQPVTNLRIGLPTGDYFARLHPDTETAVTNALLVLDSLTNQSREVALPDAPNFAPLLAESYAWHEEYLNDESNHSQYNPVTLERLLAAGAVSTADYIRAQQELLRTRHLINDVFNEVDVLITPTAPGLPERIDQAINPSQANTAEQSTRNTAPFNLYGIPTISVPIGFSDSGLPIGLQISSANLGEEVMFSLAHAFQQATDWHTEIPAIQV